MLDGSPMVIRELLMEAPSLTAQRAFYAGGLGLPVVEDAPEQVVFRVGETRMGFRRAAPGTSPTYHFAFHVPANRFREAKAWLGGQAELLRFEGDDEFDFDSWSASAAYALDLAGNIVEVIAHRALPTATAEPFAAAWLLGVAEVGLPVADVPAAVAVLEEQFGIGLWDRAEITPGGITPVGEQGATFIVVPLGRPWFPVAVESSDFPLEVVIGGVHEGKLELAPHPYRIRGAG